VKIVLENNLQGKLSESDLKKDDSPFKILMKIPLNELKPLISDYVNAGSCSMFLFTLDETCIQSINNRLASLSKLVKPADRKQGIKLTDISFNENNREILIEHQLWQGEKILPAWDSEKGPLFVSYNPIETIISTIYLDFGILAVRTSQQDLANTIKNFDINVLGGGDAQSLKIEGENISKILEWASKIRHANFRLQQEISSLSMTSAQNMETKEYVDLRKVEDFWNWKDKGELIGVYIILSIKEDEDERIGFNLNFKNGKIFFKTAVNEINIRWVLNELLREIKIERPRPSLQKTMFRYLERGT